MDRSVVVGVKEITYHDCYDVRVELIDPEAMGVMPDPGETLEPEEMTSAYSKEGVYLGDPKMAAMLVKKFGIASFEKTEPDHNVCSIGFAPKSNKWYGWSHRAIYGFTIGSTCKEGDCHYVPSSFSEIGRTCDQRKGDMCRARAYYRMAPVAVGGDPETQAIGTVGPVRGIVHCTIENCVIEIGRGEWTAETMEDAKLMAIDFAKGVS